MDLMRPYLPGLINKSAPNFERKTVGDIIGQLIPWFYAFIGIILLIYLIMGGFQFMTSAGDPKASEAAKKKITNAFIGFILVFVSYWIVVVIAEVLGIWKIRFIF